MLQKCLLILCVLSAAILIGCSTTETNTNTSTANTNKATTTTSTPATTTSSTAPAGEKIGVPECDDYIAKYEACLGKVPEAGRAAYKSSFEQLRASWKKLAENPATKASLATACKTALQQQTTAWKAYGCN